MAEPELRYVGHARGRWRDEPACKFKGPELSSHLGSVWLAPEASLLKPSVRASLGALSCSLLPFHVFLQKTACHLGWTQVLHLEDTTADS